MFRFLVLLAILACGLAAPTKPFTSKFIKTAPVKAAPEAAPAKPFTSKFIKSTPVKAVAPAAAPAKPVSRFTKSAPVKAAAAPEAAPAKPFTSKFIKSAPVKAAAPVAAPAKPVSRFTKTAPVKAAPVAAPVKPVSKFTKAAPAPVKKAAPAAVKSVSSFKRAAPAPAKKFEVSPGFAGGLVGADVEAGEFDPFGLSIDKSQETLEWYRAAELKHARICMLASVGLLVQPAFHLPDPVFESTKGYGAVIQLLNERPEAIWQILIALAAIETTILFNEDAIPTKIENFNFDPFGVRKSQNLDDPEKFEAMQLRELKNGRLAMLGVAGTLLQEYVSGGKGVYEL